MQSNSFHVNHQSLNTVKQWCGGDSFCLRVTEFFISTVILLLEIVKGQAKKPWFWKYIYCSIPYCNIPVPLFLSVKTFYSGFWEFSNGSMPPFPSKPPSEKNFSQVKITVVYSCILVTQMSLLLTCKGPHTPALYCYLFPRAKDPTPKTTFLNTARYPVSHHTFSQMPHLSSRKVPVNVFSSCKYCL